MLKHMDIALSFTVFIAVWGRTRHGGTEGVSKGSIRFLREMGSAGKVARIARQITSRSCKESRLGPQSDRSAVPNSPTDP
jgi:hypothetical protein